MTPWRWIVAGSVGLLLTALPHSLGQAPASHSLPATNVAGPQAEGLSPAEFRVRVAKLRDRAAKLAGAGAAFGGLDALHYGWFDRPRTRATLAVLVKTTMVLEREARLRGRGNGAIPEGSIRAMLTWTDQALARAAHSSPDPTFRPHRLRVSTADLAASGLPASAGLRPLPPLFGLVDRATSTRHHDLFGALDLMAAMGMRVYPRLAKEMLEPAGGDLLRRRAGELGMAVLEISPEPGHEASVVPVTLRELIESPSQLATKRQAIIALTDPIGGENWPASLARRGLARGMSGSGRFAVLYWQAPHYRGRHDVPPAAIAAAMWAHAIEGQALGLLPGWRDLRDGSGSPYGSVFVDPARMETVAHTALELMRHAEVMAALSPRQSDPRIAIVLDADAVDEKDDNAWARWVEPIWQALLDRQIPFDVIGSSSAYGEPHSRYQIVVPISSTRDREPAAVMASLEQALTVHGESTSRVRARELDGKLATDVFIRTAATQDGRSVIALINLSDRERRVKLQHDSPLAPQRDVLSREHVNKPGENLALRPWQTRLLVPVR